MLVFLTAASGIVAAGVEPQEYKCDATSGALTETLPDATLNVGLPIYFTKIDTSINTVTINTTSSQTIGDGALSVILFSQGSTLSVLSDGIGWLVLSKSYILANGYGRATAQAAAVASVTAYTVGTADSSFLVSGNVLVTAAVTASFTMTVNYTDESNTSRTLVLTFSNITGTLLSTITNVTGTGAYEGVPLHIRCKAATTITMATTGTFTSVTYNVEGAITKIA